MFFFKKYFYFSIFLKSKNNKNCFFVKFLKNKFFIKILSLHLVFFFYLNSFFNFFFLKNFKYTPQSFFCFNNIHFFNSKTFSYFKY